MHLDFCVYSLQSILQMIDNNSEAIIYNFTQIYSRRRAVVQSL